MHMQSETIEGTAWILGKYVGWWTVNAWEKCVRKLSSKRRQRLGV